MFADVSLGREFFSQLQAWDWKIAREVAARGCPECGGPLHQGNYQRKPRGGALAEAGEEFTLRYSLCCGRRGCRQRSTPPSLRFLGRRVYLEAVVLLASVYVQMAGSLREASEAMRVPGTTLHRWGWWWRGAFVTTSTWLELRGRFAPPPPDEATLPLSFMKRVAFEVGASDDDEVGASDDDEVGASDDDEVGASDDDVLFAARLLAPATTTSVTDAAYFVREAAARSGVTQRM